MRARAYSVIAVLCVAIAVAVADTASAATFRVTRADDPVPPVCLPGDCSLRGAVIAADALPGGDRIVLRQAVRHELTTPNPAPGGGEGEDDALRGDLDVRGGPLQIIHRGGGRATIDANRLDRVLEIAADSPTRLEGVVLVGGHAVGAGPEDGGDGGAIRARASVTIIDSQLRHNRATGDGGAVHLAGEAKLRLSRSSLVRNVAWGSGGGAYLEGPERDAVARVHRSTVHANQAGAGGGIAAVSGTVRVTSSTISANNATIGPGGGVRADAPARILLFNSTVAENVSAGSGGGIYAAGRGGMNATTVARNRADADADGSGAGAGVASVPSGFEVENSIIALNRLGTGELADCAGGRFDSGGDNLLSGFPPGTCGGFDFVGDIVRKRPGLKRLARNRGETKTIALKPSSPAVDAAGPRSSPKRDQRRVKRDERPDIGAYELIQRSGKPKRGPRKRRARRGRG